MRDPMVLRALPPMRICVDVRAGVACQRFVGREAVRLPTVNCLSLHRVTSLSVSGTSVPVRSKQRCNS
jgi:hypothetical protein